MPSPYYLRPDETHLPEGPDDTLDPSEAPTDAAERSVPASAWPRQNDARGPQGPADAPAAPPPTDPARRGLAPFEWPRNGSPNRPRHLATMTLGDLDPDIALWPQIVVNIWPFKGPPTTGVYPTGWLGVDNGGTPYVCIAGGQPGTWMAIAPGGTNIYNVVTQFGADNTGTSPTATPFANALTAAVGAGGNAIIYAPAGRYLGPNIGGSFTTNPATQQPGPIFYTGDGDLRTIFLASAAQNRIVNTVGLSPYFDGICFDEQGFAVTAVNCITQFQNGGSLANCSAPGGGLVITLGSQIGSAVLPPGTLVTITQAQNGPFYDGTIASYNVNGGGAGIDTITVNANAQYPTVGAVAGGSLRYGYATDPIRVSFRRCRVRNRGVGYAVLTVPNLAGTFTLTWGAQNVTGVSGTVNAAQLQTILNQNTALSAPPQLGFVCCPFGANQIVISAIGGKNFSVSAWTGGGSGPSVTNQQNQGFGINVGDTSQARPTGVEDCYVRDLTIENDLGDQQESLNIAASRLHVRGVNYRNTYVQRASISAGSNLLTFDGVLLSPPIAQNVAAGIPGTPVAVAGAGTPYGLLSETGTVNVNFPTQVTLSSALTGPEYAAVVAGVQLTVGTSPTPQTVTVTNILNLSGGVTVLEVTPALGAGTGMSLTLGTTPLTAYVTGVSIITAPNGLAQCTQLTLSANATTSVSEALVGVMGGRGPINLFSFDYAEARDVNAWLGAGHNSDISAIGQNYLGRSICVIWDGFTVEDPFYIGATVPVLADASYIKTANWVLPSTCFVRHAPFNSGQVIEHNSPVFNGGLQWAAPLTSCTINGGFIGISSNVGNGALNCSAGGSPVLGPCFLNGTRVNVGSGVVIGSTLNSAASTPVFEIHWTGGGGTYGSFFIGSYATSGVGNRIALAPASTVARVTGVNPPKAGLPLGPAFPALGVGTQSWTNGSGTDADIFLIAGSVTQAMVNGVNASLTGPWHVIAGGNIVFSYTTTPTLNVVYQ